MNTFLRITSAFALAVPLFASAGPELASSAPPVMAKPGKVLFEDDFSRPEITPKWKTGKGWFTIKDGVVTATENPEDNHGAYRKANFPYKDVIAEVSYKLEGSPRFNFTVDDNTYKGSHAGHIARVTIAKEQVQLGDSKFGTMRNDVHDKMQDPKTTAEEKKALQASIKDKAAGFKINADPAAWHRLRMEIVGDEMLVSIDGKPVGYLKSEGVAHPTKNLLGFTVSGKSALFDDVKVWEAEPNAEWATRRAEVLAALKK